MKRIFLTIIGAVVCTASAYAEVSPLSFGVKGSGVVSNVSEIAKNASQGEEGKGMIKNLGAGFGGYFEYAFHDMVGVGVDLAYAGGIVGKTAIKGAKDDKNDTSFTQHAVRILLPYVSITPLGREDREEIGVMYINVGLQHDIRLAANKTEKQKADEPYAKEGVNFWGFGIGGAIGYEFPFNLTLEVKGGYEFTDYFTEKLKGRTTGNDKKSSNLSNVGLAVGYNFATLLED